MKRHHKFLAAAALVLAIAWVAWNALLVESDVAGVADEVQAPAGDGPP